MLHRRKCKDEWGCVPETLGRALGVGNLSMAEKSPVGWGDVIATRRLD